MAKTEIIAAIEISSSRITGIAGSKTDDGGIMVCAFAQGNATNFVKKGVILNINEAARAMGDIVAEMETQMSSKIAKVYLSISGQTLRTVKNEVCRTVRDGELVSEDLINEIRDENRNYPLVDADILDVEPQEYNIDNTLVMQPVGVAGHDVKATFLNTIARSNVKKNLEYSAGQAHLEIADDLVVGPRALAAAVLTDSELRSGCALVDFGASTTTISVYKNNMLRYLSVLPLGSENITKDLTALQKEEDEARRLKEEYGNALLDTVGEAPKDFSAKEWEDFNDLITARTEEILKNVWNQIRQSTYTNKLYSGVIFTGGGSNMKNLGEAFAKISSQNKIRIARFPECNIEGPQKAKRLDCTLNTVYGMLLLGNENCCREEKAPQTLSRSIETPDIFEDDSDLKRQEEETRKKIEEQRKKDAEEKARTERNKKREGRSRDNLFKKLGKKINILSDELFGEDNSDSLK